MKLRLLVILPTIGKTGGGVSEVARLYVEQWVGYEDAEIEVVTLDTHDTAQARREWPDVKIRAFKKIGPARFGASFSMLRFLLAHDYDVAHVHGVWMFHVYAVLRWSYRFTRSYIVTPHGMLEPWILRRSKLLKKIVSLLFQNQFLKNAARIHTLNAKETIDVRAIVPEVNVLEVPNFIPEIKISSSRPSWWQPDFEDKRVLLFLGRIHDKKGWRELLHAWDRVCSADSKFSFNHQLVFCGWLDDAQGFENEIARLASKHGNVIYGGVQYGDDKFLSYKSADFFILPSKSEGLPMTVLEAWATGCPVMMTVNCNLPVAFEKNAAICIGDDVTEIQKALLDLPHIQIEQIEILRRNAYELLESNFSPQICARKLWEELRAVSIKKI